MALVLGVCFAIPAIIIYKIYAARPANERAEPFFQNLQNAALVLLAIALISIGYFFFFSLPRMFS